MQWVCGSSAAACDAPACDAPACDVPYCAARYAAKRYQTPQVYSGGKDGNLLQERFLAKSMQRANTSIQHFNTALHTTFNGEFKHAK